MSIRGIRCESTINNWLEIKRACGKPVEYLVKIKKLRQTTTDAELASPSTTVPHFTRKSEVRERWPCSGTPGCKGISRCRPWRCCHALITLELNGHHQHLHLGQSWLDRHRHVRLLPEEDVHVRNVNMISILLRSFTMLRDIFTIVFRAPVSRSRQVSLLFFIVYCSSLFCYVFATASYPLL